MAKEYTCEACGKTFKKTWDDEEAKEEYENNFGEFREEDVATFCDDCYKAMTEPQKGAED